MGEGWYHVLRVVKEIMAKEFTCFQCSILTNGAFCGFLTFLWYKLRFFLAIFSMLLTTPPFNIIKNEAAMVLRRVVCTTWNQKPIESMAKSKQGKHALKRRKSVESYCHYVRHPISFPHLEVTPIGHGYIIVLVWRHIHLPSRWKTT